MKRKDDKEKKKSGMNSPKGKEERKGKEEAQNNNSSVDVEWGDKDKVDLKDIKLKQNFLLVATSNKPKMVDIRNKVGMIKKNGGKVEVLPGLAASKWLEAVTQNTRADNQLALANSEMVLPTHHHGEVAHAIRHVLYGGKVIVSADTEVNDKFIQWHKTKSDKKVKVSEEIKKQELKEPIFQRRKELQELLKAMQSIKKQQDILDAEEKPTSKEVHVKASDLHKIQLAANPAIHAAQMKEEYLAGAKLSDWMEHIQKDQFKQIKDAVKKHIGDFLDKREKKKVIIFWIRHSSENERTSTNKPGHLRALLDGAKEALRDNNGSSSSSSSSSSRQVLIIFMGDDGDSVKVSSTDKSLSLQGAHMDAEISQPDGAGTGRLTQVQQAFYLTEVLATVKADLIVGERSGLIDKLALLGQSPAIQLELEKNDTEVRLPEANRLGMGFGQIAYVQPDAKASTKPPAVQKRVKKTAQYAIREHRERVNAILHAFPEDPEIKQALKERETEKQKEEREAQRDEETLPVQLSDFFES